ncbi:MAG TPA: hypothetical protein VFJ43_07790 [Bacteroidia bacterium]|nr:hypothetical protein [Bacteroidia bacterium]
MNIIKKSTPCVSIVYVAEATINYVSSFSDSDVLRRYIRMTN